jgi:hypothetical protein
MTETQAYYRPQYNRSPARRQVKPETEWLRYVRRRLALAFGPRQRLIKILGGLGQESGIADLVGVINGRAVALELKTPGGRHKVSEAQKDFLITWSAAGGISVVIDSPEALEELIEKLKPVQQKLF